MQANGQVGSTALSDGGPVPKTLTAVGNAHITASSNFSGAGSLSLDGDGDSVSVTAERTDLVFGTGDFTIEFFAKKPANGLQGYDPVLSTYTNNYASDGYQVELSSTQGFMFYGAPSLGSQAVVYAQVNLNPNDSTWHHWAITRSGTTIRMFKDGILLTAVNNTSDIPAKTMSIGTTYGGYSFNGELQQLRVTKGAARYTSNFTPATQPFATSGVNASVLGHRKGDLQSITNAIGQVTQYTQYDALGRVRQLIDAKGITTDLTYTARGLIGSVAVVAPGMSPRITTYTYDYAGQLTSVTEPDGTSVSISYDGAHRVTGFTDARGNSVSYTLDAEGNRIGEEVRDPTAVLQRTVSRSFDALNRVQQVTGATR
jgi:YD repeat-containing protein